MLASRRNGTLYIGITSEIAKRVSEHKDKIYSGFTAQYGVDKLVYYEVYADIETAIRREKAIKKWKRAWKIQLIEKSNPEWRDLFNELTA